MRLFKKGILVMLKTTLLSLLLGLSTQVWAKPATIASFLPQNLSETTNQIKVSFSEKMVALGVNPQAEIFDFSCSPQVAGQAQWQDEKNWTFDFATKLYANNLPGGTRCQLTLKPGVKSLAGTPVTGKLTYKFEIDGPNIIAIFPGDTNGVSKATVSEDQIFAIGLDADLDQSSVLTNAYFKVEGRASPVQIRVLPEAEKRALMKAENFPGYRFDKELPMMMIQGKERFPANKKVSLVWGAGIKSSQSGLSRHNTLVLPYESRSLLMATFTCNRENAKADCSPFSDMSVAFSSSVPADLARQIRLVNVADGKAIFAEVGKGASAVDQVTFPATIKERQTFKLEIPTGIIDDTGRPLANASSFPLVVKTADFPPLAKFAAEFGIIEAGVAPVLLPATLRSLETKVITKGMTAVTGTSMRIPAASFVEVVQWMKALDIRNNAARELKNRDRSIFAASPRKPNTFAIPVQNKGKDFEVVGIPLAGPGFYVVELQSKLLGRSLLGKDTSMFVPTGALVTNMAVHVKWGRENSVFWVTALDSGAPVSGATVTLHDCAGQDISTMQTDGNGIAKLPGNLASMLNLHACSEKKGEEDPYTKYDHGFFVSAQKGGDFTFTHSGWNEGLEVWRFGNVFEASPDEKAPDILAHTVLDRTLLRAGDTVSMKHFIRLPSSAGIGLLAAADLPGQVWIEHADSQTRYTAELKWAADGTAVAQLAIPKDAKLGLYNISLIKMGGKPGQQEVAAQFYTSSFQVMEFKVPQLKGTIAFPAPVQRLVQPGKLDAQLSVNYQDGGPAANKAVTFRYTIGKARGLGFADYPDFSFANDRIVEKQSRSQDGSETNETTTQLPVRLDAKGTSVVTIPGLAGFDSARDVTAQLEFTDSNGEAQNITRSLKIYPAGLLAGVNAENSYSSPKHIQFHAAIVDLRGKPIAGAVPAMELFEEIVYTHKTRMVGGFYSSESVTEVKRVPAQFKCQAATNAQGMVNCSVDAPASGTYIVQTEIRDAAGNASYGSDRVYVRGSNRAWFPSDNNDRMDLIAQKKDVQAGEQAVMQVKMPFDTATVLVTVEREGVIDSFVTTVSTSNPVIKVPIKANYAPNVYVSALAVRGRVSGTADETATVDLGKPAFKLGIAALNVGWKQHEIKVEVNAPKESLKPRALASVDLTAVNAQGKPVPGAEFAIAVVDEGLLELAKNRSWDLLGMMMGRRPLSVETSTAQMQVVGKRHFGLKAKPTGGDGGQAPTRELFDTLVYWNSRVTADANGKVNVKFRMNDSLSKFRVVAIAHLGADQFGKGEASIVTAQDVAVIPTIAQVSRNGDSFATEFTVRNATKLQKTVVLKGKVKLTFADGHVEYRDLTGQTIVIDPLDSKLITLGDVNIPDGVVKAEYDVAAVDQTGQPVDSIHVTQKVQPSVLTRTWMAQINRVDQTFSPVNVELPQTALPNQGGVKVALLSSLAGGLGTVKDKFYSYPYMTIEYLISYAAASGDTRYWDTAMRRLPAYLDSEGLVKYYTSAGDMPGSDVLTAYVLSVSSYSGMKIPQDLQDHMSEGLSAFAQGKGKWAHSAQSPNDIFIRRVNAIEALAHFGKAQAVWLSALPKVLNEQVPTWTMINLVSAYAMLKDAGGRDAKLNEYQQVLRTRLVRIGTGLKFNENGLRPLYGMSSADSDQAQWILVLSTTPELATAWQNDVPLLVQGAVQMMNRGAWDMTVANAYGVLAMKAFTKAFEPAPVSGVTNVAVNATKQAFDWSTQQHRSGGDLNFGWPGPGQYRVDIGHQGAGAPWSIVSVSAAVPLLHKVENHIAVEKTVAPQKLVYKVGDEVTVTLKIKAQTELSNVSLIDPIPAGCKIVGSGLDNDPGRGGPISRGWIWPDSQELAADAYRASYGSVPAQEFQVIYKMRVNNAGTFKMPPTRIEALYMPENFAEVPNELFKVVPQ